MANQNESKTIFSALIWKFLERFGVQVSLFVLQIVLARILDPEHYGILSLMLVFTTLATVFVQRGFNTALVQNKDVTEEDYSSVFWLTIGVAAVLYAILFVTAPMIARFYKMPELVAPFRVLCLILFPGGFNSVQVAKISRGMDFKKVFRSNISAIVISGVAGILAALWGAGLWALVLQRLLYQVIACVVMWFTVQWRPKLVFNVARVKVLFAYGWKLLVSNLIDTLYQDLRSLVVGKQYDASALAYYNRGKQFPQFIITAVNNTVQTVMLPSMSRKQDDPEKLKALMRQSITLSSYIIFPMMLGLAGVATPLVKILLTEKWLPCVPYLQIYCFSLAFRPIHSCNLQAINAMGRSDIYLKLEIIKKVMGVAAIAIAVLFFDTPIAVAVTGVITDMIGTFLNAFPNKKLAGYAFAEQLRDLLPSLLASVVMMASVLAVGMLPLGNFAILVLQVIAGVLVYLAISAAFRMKPYKTLMGAVMKFLHKKKKPAA